MAKKKAVGIAYLTHPVDAETKAMYRDEGYRIVDIRFAPEKIGKDDIRDDEKKPAKSAKKAEESAVNDDG